jgi:hypothetical protein
MTNQAAQTMPSNIVERLASAKDKLPAGSDERMAVWRAIEYFRALSQTAGVTSERIAPVQGYTPGIPWSMHLEAYDVYCKRYGKQQALIEGGCRGGFGTNELDMFIPGWRDRLSEFNAMKARIAELEAMLAAAPAASGGECQSGASVSERARDESLLELIVRYGNSREASFRRDGEEQKQAARDESADLYVRIVAAIEQALTQQHALSSPRQEGEAVQNALFWKKMHATAMALVEVQNAELARYKDALATTTNRDEISSKLTSTIEVDSTAASTQGLRELVQRWRTEAEDNKHLGGSWHKTDLCNTHADELESLLTSPTTGADGESLVEKGAGS